MNEIIFWSGIWPDNFTRPIGTYQLAFWLRKHNVECQVIDFCQFFTKEELFEMTSKFISPKTKYIGISSSFWPLTEEIPENILETINLIRQEYKHIKIIIGGPRADNHKVKDIADIVIIGEAENKLLNLIKNTNIGVSLFDITKLEHRFNYKDCIVDNEVLPLELGRGCIFKCKFCGHHNLGKPRHTYQRNIELIEEEILYNFENFKTTKYLYLDDTVNEDPDKVLNLSRIPKKLNIDLSWTGYLRADLIWSNPDSMDQLIQSGLKSCFFGIETFNPQSSMIIGKGWNGKNAKSFLPKLYKEYWGGEINIWSNFIIGLPFEDNYSLNSTLEWCMKNNIGYSNFAPLTLYNSRTDTGTKSIFTKNYKDYGYKLNEQSFWKNDYMDELEAQKISKEFNKQLTSINRYSSWELFELSNCNLNIDILKKIKKISKSKFKSVFIKNFLQIYKNKLLALT